jgi:hypothetical protein
VKNTRRNRKKYVRFANKKDPTHIPCCNWGCHKKPGLAVQFLCIEYYGPVPGASTVAGWTPRSTATQKFIKYLAYCFRHKHRIDNKNGDGVKYIAVSKQDYIVGQVIES